MSIFATKDIDQIQAEASGAGAGHHAQARARPGRSGLSWHWRHHRNGHLRVDRTSRSRAPGRPSCCHDSRRLRVHAHEPLLRRVRVDRADRRIGLTPGWLRDARRVRRVDHRLGLDSRSTRSAPPPSRSAGQDISSASCTTSASSFPPRSAPHPARSRRSPTAARRRSSACQP